jgi:hypothetical protein
VLGERALGTFSRCAFTSNSASSPATATPSGHGPALALYSGSEAGSYSAAWLQGCTFADNAADTRGAASIATDHCRVFSEAAASPEVFVASGARTESPWRLVQADDPAASAAASSGGRIAGFRSLPFITDTSKALKDALAVCEHLSVLHVLRFAIAMLLQPCLTSGHWYGRTTMWWLRWLQVGGK